MALRRFAPLTLSLWLPCLLLVLSAACATSEKAKKASKGVRRIEVGWSEEKVRKKAGKPPAVEGSGGVERFWYRVGDVPPSCAAVDVVAGRVEAVHEEASCPALLVADEKPKASAMKKGRVRLGMSAAEVEEKLGKPTFVTASEGTETLFWREALGPMTQNPPYARVDIGPDGRVIAFRDVYPAPDVVDEDVPTTDEKNVAVRKLRVGMDEQHVKKKLGKPDETRTESGLRVLEWRHSILGVPHLVDRVELKEGRVYSIRQLDLRRNVLLGENPRVRAERKEREAKARAAAAALIGAAMMDAAAEDASRSPSEQGESSSSGAKVKRTPERSCAQDCAHLNEAGEYAKCMQRCKATGRF